MELMSGLNECALRLMMAANGGRAKIACRMFAALVVEAGLAMKIADSISATELTSGIK